LIDFAAYQIGLSVRTSFCASTVNSSVCVASIATAKRYTSVLGGYVSARIAKHDELLNGALSSILCVGGGTYAVISGSAADDLCR